jgi:hypothetical protein
MKIYILDIETKPNLAYVWGIWQQNVLPSGMVEPSEIISYAAKQLGRKRTYYRDERQGVKRMLRGLWKILDDADVIIGHNSDKFDLKLIRAALLREGFKPPSPFLQIDTLKIARKEFKFARNSLSALAKELGVSQKSEHKKFPGIKLWTECLKGNEDAWKEMKAYNIQDVLVTEEVYMKLRPWSSSHPNLSKPDGSCSCAVCGHNEVQYRGYYTSRVGVTYRRFVCKSCNSWGREAQLDKDVPRRFGRNV